MTFEEFVADELPGLARYARALTGDRHDAHDVLADALLTAQLRWRRIGAMDHPAAYVRRIVTTTFLGSRRRWSARTIRVTTSGELPEVSVADSTDRVDDRDHLARLLSRLPRRQRAAIVLRYYTGLADAEIADELRCRAGTVRSLVSRGLAAMRIDDGAAADPAHATDVAAQPGTAPSHRTIPESKDQP